MSQYAYILEPYKGRNTRHECPACKRRGEFTRYIGTETGEPIADHVGKCNRDSNCGYHYTPKQHFESNPDERPVFEPQTARKEPETPKRTTFPIETMNATMAHYGLNSLALFLSRRLGDGIAAELLARYNVGTSKLWPGAVVFWMVDHLGRVRSGQIMRYNTETGRRDKDKNSWVHSVLKTADFELTRCLFGEHLLRDRPDKPVGVVESQKTAMICAAIFPSFVWVATCGKGNLNRKTCAALAGRDVVIFPDADGYDKWVMAANDLRPICKTLKINQHVKSIATAADTAAGRDIVDFLEVDESTGQFLEGGSPVSWNVGPDFYQYSTPSARPMKATKPKPARLAVIGDGEQQHGETLSKMIEKNPQLVDFMEKFNMEIA